MKPLEKVTDSNWKDADCGDWIADLLEETATANPQELADLILKKAIDNYSGKINDDITILVAKVWEKV